MTDQDVTAAHERVNHFTGIGCLLQGLALLTPFALGAAWGAAGVLVGIDQPYVAGLTLHGNTHIFSPLRPLRLCG